MILNEFEMKNFLVILFAPVLLLGCSELLDEVPEDRLAATNFYQSEADAEAATLAIVERIRSTELYVALFPLQVNVLDDYIEGRGTASEISNYQGYSSFSINRSDRMWIAFYQTIHRANTVLENVAPIDMDPVKRSQLLGEAYFWRAFCYYMLVRNWGGVPIRTKVSSSDADIAQPRATEQQVYDLIVEDLLVAEADLPGNQGLVGRPTSWAAKTMLADVYLTLGDWAKASEKAKDVIEAGIFSLVQVSVPDDFLKVFGPDITNSSEEIIAVKFSRSIGTGVPFYAHTAPAGYSIGGARVFLGNIASGFFDAWSDSDLRKEYNIYTSYKDANGNTVDLPVEEPMLFRKFRDSQASAVFGHGCDYPLYRYPDALLIFAEAENEINNGPTAEAYEAINQVKRRAYGFDPNVANPSVDLAGMTEEEFKDAILLERAYEFMMECKRWYDLKRTGRARSTMETIGKTFSDTHLLWPIPESEIQNNPAISPSDQNPI